MSNIPLLLLSNTFGEWLITINNVIAENNNSSANGVSNTLTRFDANGSLTFNELNSNNVQLKVGPAINEVRTDFQQNNHTSVATTGAILELLTGSNSILPLRLESLRFGTSFDSVNAISKSFSASDPNTLLTSNAIYNFLTGTRTLSFDLRSDSIRIGSGPVITEIATTFSSIDNSTVPTTSAVSNYLSSAATINLDLASLRLNTGQSVNKIANNFNSVDDTTLVTAKAVYNLVGGIDNDIGTIEGRSIDLGSTYVVNNFAIDFSTITHYSLPTVTAVKDFITSGNYSLDVSANSLTATNLHTNAISIDGHTINSIRTDFNLLSNDELVTSNAVYNLLTDGNVVLNSQFSNTHTSSISINGYSINAVANVINAANTNNHTLGTTQGIYDLLSGGVTTVPPLPISANSFSFPGGTGNTSVNSIATNFSSINDNSLVTANAVYNLLTDGSVNLAVDFDSITLVNGVTVNGIATAITTANTNDYTLATTKAVHDTIGSGVGNITVAQVETNDLYSFQVSLGNYAFGRSTAQNAASAGTATLATPWVYTSTLEAYDQKNASGTGIILSANSSSPAGETVAANNIAFFTGGSIRLKVNNTEIDAGSSIVKTTATPSASSHLITKAFADATYNPVGSTGTRIANNAINVDIDANNIVFTGNSEPATNDTYTLGNSTNRFKDLYLSGSAFISDDSAITSSNGSIQFNANNQTIEVLGNGSSVTGKLTLNCEMNSHGQTIVPQPHSAAVTNTLTLPANGSQEIVGTIATQTLTNKTLGQTSLSGDLLPTADSTYNLGSPANKFKDLYLSSSTLWLGDLIKLDTSSGVAKFLKRDPNSLPYIFSIIGGDSANAISHVNTTFSYSPARTALSELTSNDLLSYLQTFASFGNAQLGTLFPPEKDATGNTSTYYNVNDYSDIIAQERPGTIASDVSEASTYALDYGVSSTATFKRPDIDVTLSLTNVSDLEGMTVHVTAFVVQNTTPHTMSGILINGNSANQFNISGVNTMNSTANTINTFDIKAVYFENEWNATCIVG